MQSLREKNVAAQVSDCTSRALQKQHLFCLQKQGILKRFCSVLSLLLSPFAFCCSLISYWQTIHWSGSCSYIQIGR